MIDQLDKISLEKFIDLACGDIDVLLDHDEKASRVELAKTATKLLNQYKTISSPTRAKRDLIDAEEVNHLRMKERCARIMVMLCRLNRYDMAKEVLAELDVDIAKLDTDEKVLKKCEAILNDAQFELKRHNEQVAEEKKLHAKNNDDIRATWSSEIAWVMSVFKMGIDVHTISAAVYANLVNQAVAHARQLAKMPSMLGYMI